jgi:hypothetical protein
VATATTHCSVGFAACCTLVYGSQFLGPAAGDLFLCKAVPIVDIQDGHSWEKRRNSDLKGVTRDIPRRLLLLLCPLCCSLCVAFTDKFRPPSACCLFSASAPSGASCVQHQQGQAPSGECAADLSLLDHAYVTHILRPSLYSHSRCMPPAHCCCSGECTSCCLKQSRGCSCCTTTALMKAHCPASLTQAASVRLLAAVWLVLVRWNSAGCVWG